MEQDQTLRMKEVRWPSLLVGAGFPLVALGELTAFVGDQPRWSTPEWWGAVGVASVTVGITALWRGCVPLARQLSADMCLLLAILAIAPTVICALGALWGYQVINVHFWTASLVFVLPALWPVAIVFLRHAGALLNKR